MYPSYRSLTPPKILLVEDDRGTARLIEEALENTGVVHDLCVVHNGEDAILAVDKANGASAPDLLLLDLQMPKKNGFEVLEHLKTREHIRRIPVVMFSSSATPEDVNRAYDLHCNAYVVKTQGLPELSKTLESVLRFWLTTAMTPFSPKLT